MKKNFDNVQTLKSSEDCKKFSKSVSYETLVGGTTTTGTERKQTRRLSKGSAVKPLSAVGTLTSLLCSSAKVMEKLLYRHSERSEGSIKTGTVIIGRGCEPIISAESLLLSLSGTSSEKQKESSLILRKAKFQAIFKFVLSSASGGAGGGKYNRISAFVSMSVLLIRRSLEKFFKKNFRDDSSFCFGFAKVLALALIFTLITNAESRANDENLCVEHKGNTVTCIEKLADENGNNSCGDNCSYRVVNENGQQVLHVYKEDISKPATIRAGAFSPTYYAGNQVLDATGSVLPLNNIMLDNDFETIGRYAFANSGAQISSANGKFVINSPSLYFAFRNKTTLNGDVYLKNITDAALESSRINGDVIIMDGEKLYGYMFSDAYINGNLIIPESVKSISYGPGLTNLRITGKIYCASGVEACYNLAKSACGTDKCLSAVDNMLASGKFSAYPDGCAKLEANLKCTKCKSSSFKLEDDGWCLRKIYTPAEAAEVLNDDNNNSVTITFKK